MSQGINGATPLQCRNNLADEAAREAALHPEIPMLHLTPVVQILSLTPVFTL
jgi:hypothetical protein